MLSYVILRQNEMRVGQNCGYLHLQLELFTVTAQPAHASSNSAAAIEYGIIGERSQILTNQNRERTVLFPIG